MWEVKSLTELEEVGVVNLGRGKIISKKDLAASPGDFPVYSSSKVGDGKFGDYGLYMFDEELITWSVDGGGRLFHFTIIDFVNAYHLFLDDDWDGEPQDPADNNGSNGEDDGNGGDGGKVREGTKPGKLKIRLADGKVRELQSMTATYFYVDGKPISAEAFLHKLFNTLQLPSLFGSEEQLREIWANPLTRRDLMNKLEKEGCHKDDLLKLQELIDAQDSDLFDVLQYIAYSKETVSRVARVETNKDNIYTLLNARQREFVSYVLRNYVEAGVDELDIARLGTVITAKYGSIHAAQQQLGNVQEIQRTFIEFQAHLYKEAVG